VQRGILTGSSAAEKVSPRSFAERTVLWSSHFRFWHIQNSY